MLDLKKTLLLPASLLLLGGCTSSGTLIIGDDDDAVGDDDDMVGDDDDAVGDDDDSVGNPFAGQYFGGMSVSSKDGGGPGGGTFCEGKGSFLIETEGALTGTAMCRLGPGGGTDREFTFTGQITPEGELREGSVSVVFGDSPSEYEVEGGIEEDFEGALYMYWFMTFGGGGGGGFDVIGEAYGWTDVDGDEPGGQGG